MPTLFAPDIFSTPQPRFGPVSDDVRARVALAVGALYPQVAAGLETVEQFIGNEINSSNFKLRSSGGEWLLKRFPSGTATAILNRQLELTQWLALAGTKVPALIPTARGDLSGFFEDSHWCVMRFIDGDFFAGDVAETLAAGVEIGRMQQALGSIPEHLTPPAKWILTPASDGAFLTAISRDDSSWSTHYGDDLARVLGESHDNIAKLGAELSERSDDIGSGRPVACHFDLHPHNLLMGDGQVRAIIDFESIVTMPMHAALGYATYKLIRQHAVKAGLSGRDGTSIRSAARGFIENLDNGGSLGLDAKSLRLFALAELARRMLLVMRLNIEKQDRRWNHVLPMHLAGLMEIELIFA